MRDVDSLSLPETVGQLFQVGFAGTAATGAVRELVEQYHVGGVVYFDRNLSDPEATASLSASLQSLARESTGVPLLVSVDHEGGKVARFPYWPAPPGAMAVGATDDPTRARELARAVGDQLRSVGVNADLAPVLDVDTNPENPVIGTRSFGSDPARVGAFGAAVAEGLQSRGVVACGKHFPGHGDTAIDSHHALPVVDADRERLAAVELRPFRRAVAAGVDAIMTAHVAVPAVEPDDTVPATLSRRVLTGLLREELGYGGVVVTDCMEMDAVADGVGTVEGAVRAVAAGADAVLVSHTPERQRAAIEAVLGAVREGRIPESRVEEAAGRVLALKRRRLGDARESGARPDPAGATAAVAEASGEVARRAVTLVRDPAGRLPLAQGTASVLSFRRGETTPAEGSSGDLAPLLDGLAAHGFDVSPHAVGPGDDLPEPAEGPLLAFTRDAARARWQVDAVRTAAPVVALAGGHPADASVLPDGTTVLATYDESPAMLAAAADVLAGQLEPRGRLPTDLP